MKPAERIALIERVARGLAWTTLGESRREAHKRRAAVIVDELEIGYEQTQRVGWVFVNTDADPEPVE